MTLLELLTLLRKHLRLVIVLPVACAIAVAAYAFLFMENTYSTTTSMYVLTLDQTATGANLYSDLNASQQVANDIAQLMDSSRVRDDAARAVGLEDLDGFEISVASETNTRVITLTVTGGEPRAVAEVANALAESVGDVAREVMNRCGPYGGPLRRRGDRRSDGYARHARARRRDRGAPGCARHRPHPARQGR